MATRSNALAGRLRAVVHRLTPPARTALDRAVDECRKRGQRHVELEHVLFALLSGEDAAILAALERSDISAGAVVEDLAVAIEAFESGSDLRPEFRSYLMEAVIGAWSIASLEEGASTIAPSSLFRSMMADSTARRLLIAASPALAILPEDLSEHFPSRRDEVPADGAAAPETTLPPDLANYASDLTERARDGEIDPILGRDDEIAQLVDILLRRRQNNPILTGDAGVGKTAVVEGLAQRIVDGDVPQALSDVRLLSLDVGALQAGTSMRGEFEKRLRGVIDAVAASPTPIVLFIDEAHTLIGAGAKEGQSDAANLLKPALARGTLRTIAATTWGEYKRYFEKDPALTRRFQVVKVPEPDLETAAVMLRGIAPALEEHHGVRITEDGLRQAVALSDRYIGGRQLPDKAIGVLDTACARVAISQSEPPPELARNRSVIRHLDAERDRLDAERARDGTDHEQALDDLATRLSDLSDKVEAQESRWLAERETVEKMADVRAQPLTEETRQEMQYLRLKLETLQGDESPLVHVEVDGRAVGAVVSDWTGIPSGEMLRKTAQNARDLAALLAERVVNQDPALDAICKRIQTYFAKIGEPGKPTGVFLLAGPSGVGKTETAHALASALFGGPQALVTVNMSEYQEAHSISGLKGAPPGYVGYGRGGVLTEAVRRRPYSVVLLDEVEKAHRDVIELFYQVFDKGMLEDSDGQIVDFRNCVILMTSNVGDMTIADTVARGVTEPARLAEAIRPELRRVFPAAFLGRLSVVPFLPLGRPALAQIARLKLDQLGARLQQMQGCEFSYDPEVLDWVIDRASETESGARNIDAIISDAISPRVARTLLEDADGDGHPAQIHLAEDPVSGFLLKTT